MYVPVYAVCMCVRVDECMYVCCSAAMVMVCCSVTWYNLVARVALLCVALRYCAVCDVRDALCSRASAVPNGIMICQHIKAGKRGNGEG